MEKYIIKVLPGEGCNEEFAPDKKLIEGIGCDEYLLLGFKGKEIVFENMMGITVEQLKRYLMTTNETASVIMQGAQIAEGYLKAWEIYNQRAKRKDAIDLFKSLIFDALENKQEAD